ncbi:hypothetical protein HDC92_000937 [Pedobacter sp. AK017]|uniref:hypothetical protein n=1 Tax=Pedobacter sp. AK017 TaxID=2723073 RepID=UPI00160DFD27|nr:hypothetical protein [Pedobacter sp. AK017]MBB5437269.1 hypothetical protein [Pedobacter sp. AK017]
MGRKKKTVNRLRDAVATARNANQAFWDRVFKLGFRGLTNAELAELACVHPSTIGRELGGLDAIATRGIGEHDYWNPFFKKFRLDGKDKKVSRQVRGMFMEMMQANFVAFMENDYMQHAILAQISVESETLTKISEAREREAAELLNLADLNFSGSGICFRAVMALILYGIYGLGLHARYNKSTVCGIDINKEKDYQKVKATIAYMIHLIWIDAGLKKKRKKRHREKIIGYEIDFE